MRGFQSGPGVSSKTYRIKEWWGYQFETLGLYREFETMLSNSEVIESWASCLPYRVIMKSCIIATLYPHTSVFPPLFQERKKRKRTKPGLSLVDARRYYQQKILSVGFSSDAGMGCTECDSKWQCSILLTLIPQTLIPKWQPRSLPLKVVGTWQVKQYGVELCRDDINVVIVNTKTKSKQAA